MTDLTPEQSRIARGLLNWPQVRLAVKSGLSEGAIRDFESGRRVPGPRKLSAIRNALKRAAFGSPQVARSKYNVKQEHWNSVTREGG
ncbi:helix-turn-helix domain-containing protein [Mesorhizobium sp. BR115XR7A]|uniref:helix-turn-helix domain-containing protein n=1 Tax=Mesorhizobium sp. BR115XR7A TaxID=2876645 RepID=UPI001CCCA267|nr:helix-turn-helix transcriptional regulator [Mesorhizobium sp. BR115XR7A]MBZ9905557.1 helix-turn-helix domain-containing protein [Mesorhizobium sp. BR115XR7A]MBZ9932898.1 helix-turn-helix domain-containing protein [Mesorhizobium sp. BR1-1-5]